MLASLLAILATITLGLLGRVIWPREVKHPQLAQLSDLECGDYPALPPELKTAGNSALTELATRRVVHHNHSNVSRYNPSSSARFGGL